MNKKAPPHVCLHLQKNYITLIMFLTMTMTIKDNNSNITLSFVHQCLNILKFSSLLTYIYVTIVKLNGEDENKTRSFLFTSQLSLTALNCSVLCPAFSTIPPPILVSGPLLNTFSWITILYLDGVESPRTKPWGTRFLPKWLFVFFSSSIVFTPLCFSSLDQFSFQNSLWFHWFCCFYSSPNPAS